MTHYTYMVYYHVTDKHYLSNTQKPPYCFLITHSYKALISDTKGMNNPPQHKSQQETLSPGENEKKIQIWKMTIAQIQQNMQG